jgi:hypothetical protein
MSLIYIVTDVEFDGPVPGRNSLLSFGSVAVSDSGEMHGEFEAVLAALPGATADPITMEFWNRHPLGWAAATANPEPPETVIARFIDWVRSLPGEPVFAAHPVGLDGPWIDFYLQSFSTARLCAGPWIEDRLFRQLPFCIMSFAAGRLSWPITKCDHPNYPAEWLGHIEHTHRAIDDARGYANLLKHLLATKATAT